MTVIVLTHEIVFKITAHSRLFDAAPFLEPMRKASVSIHKKLPKKCTSCSKRAIRRASAQLAGAFTSLAVQESRLEPNRLPALKKVMNSILKLDIGEVELHYTDAKGQNAELRF